MSISAIVANIVFSIGGFILGFYVALIRLRVERNPENIMDGDKTTTRTEPHFTAGQILGVLILLLAVGSTVTSVMASSDQRRSAQHLQRIAACQAEFNKVYRLALTERSEAANAERKAMRAMLAVILDPASTEQTRREAVERYDTALRQAETTRQQNPLPTNDRCD